MGYVGNQTTNSYSSFDKQDLTGVTGSPAKRGFTLSHAVANAQEIEVFVNNVRQEPGEAYTVSGTGLTMTGDVETTDDFYVVFQGKALQTIVPPDDSVTKAKMGTTELDLATIKDSAGTNTAITIDSSGIVLFPKIPCACVTINLSNTQDNTNPYTTTGVDILFNKVTINQGSVYDTTNGRFTAPIAGIYEFSYTFLCDDDSGANVNYVDMFKNGVSYVSAAGSRSYDQSSSSYGSMSQKTLVDLAKDDYLTLRLISGGFHLESGGSYHSVVFKLVG